MLVGKRIEKYLMYFQASVFCLLIIEVAFLLFPQYQKTSIALFLIAGFLGTSLFWISDRKELRSSIMIDIICILLIVVSFFKTDLFGVYKWMLAITSLLFLLLDMGRGRNQLMRKGKNAIRFNGTSNFLLLMQILLMNVFGVLIGIAIYDPSKIAGIALCVTVVALFFMRELKFFNLSMVWNDHLKKELRCTPCIDLCFITVFGYYLGYEEFSIIVVPIVLFFVIDMLRYFLEKQIIKADG